MTSEFDIWQSANLLVDLHGADAPIRAAQHADDLLAASDIEGRGAWLRILEAVKELLATEPPGPTHCVARRAHLRARGEGRDVGTIAYSVTFAQHHPVRRGILARTACK